MQIPLGIAFLVINDKISKEMSDRAEQAVKKQFKRLGYGIFRPPDHGKKKLAITKKRGRPDFIICRSGTTTMICEVKAILSDKYLSDEDVQACTIYDNLELRFKKIDDDLADAVRQRDQLVEDFPKYKPLPFLVALIPDFFNKRPLESYRCSFNEDVSGILTIGKNILIEKAADKLSAEDQQRCFEAGQPSVLVPPSKHFVLIINEAATRKVPKDFQMHCIIRKS